MSARRLEQSIRFLIALTFFVPLVVLPSHFIFPFIVPKILLFRSLVLLMIAGYILLLFLGWQQYRLTSSPLHIVVLLFLLTFLVSTFAGVDWYKSFWDNHERMLGLFTLFHYVAYYLIASVVIRDWREWQKFFRIFLAAGSLVMIIGLLQKLNPELLVNRGSARVSSTLGNPIYVGGYGLFLLTIGYLLFVKTKERFWKWFAAIGALLGFSGIITSGTRGTFFAFLISLPVLLLCYHFSLKGESRRVVRLLSAVVIGATIVLSILFFFRHTSFVSNLPALGRLYQTSVQGFLDSARVRAWGIALDAWKERPLFGWGPNNYFYAFNAYYEPEFLEYGWGETWFDNAHNIVMNTLADRGAVGLIVYIGIFVVAIGMLIRRFREGKVDAHVLSIGVAFLVAHFIHNVFVFENPTSYLYFFFFLAFVHQQCSQPDTPGATVKKTASPALSGAVYVVAFLLLWMANVTPARANTKTLYTIQSLLVTKSDALILFDQAAELRSPHIDDMRNDFARTVGENVFRYVQAQQGELALQLIDRSILELEKNRLVHPLDIRVNILESQLFAIASQLTGEPTFMDQAAIILQDALAKSPKRQQLHFQLSAVQLERAQTDESIRLLRSTIEDDPEVGEGWWRLATVYNQLGLPEKARETLEEARERGVRFDAEGKRIVEQLTKALSQSATAAQP